MGGWVEIYQLGFVWSIVDIVVVGDQDQMVIGGDGQIFWFV